MTDPDRHARTARLEGVGPAGLRRIADAGVLVVGAGGLGSPVLQYLAAAGVGRLGIVDPDAVEESNLARQLVHADRVGMRKTASAALAVRGIDPSVEVVEHPVAVTAATARALLERWDVVVDATDDPAARYATSDAAALLGIPVVWGAALGLEGQLTVFGTGPDGPVDFRDLHPVPPAGVLDTCATTGVLGPVCGVIGSAMAVEVLKLLTGVGTPLIGRVLHYDGGAAAWHDIPLRRRADRAAVTAPAVTAASADAPPAIEWADRGDRIVIDVRRLEEHDARHLDGDVLMPLEELLADPSRAGSAPVLLYCASGRRSARAAERLAEAGIDAVSLRGGIRSLPDGEQGAGEQGAAERAPSSPSEPGSSSTPGADEARSAR